MDLSFVLYLAGIAACLFVILSVFKDSREAWRVFNKNREHASGLAKQISGIVQTSTFAFTIIIISSITNFGVLLFIFYGFPNAFFSPFFLTGIIAGIVASIYRMLPVILFVVKSTPEQIRLVYEQAKFDTKKFDPLMWKIFLKLWLAESLFNVSTRLYSFAGGDTVYYEIPQIVLNQTGKDFLLFMLSFVLSLGFSIYFFIFIRVALRKKLGTLI